MREEWVPWSASALVTGAMALVMSQLIAPALGDRDIGEVMNIATENPGQWITMSMLWALSSAGFILGIPTVLTLFEDRGRILGSVGCVVFAVGALGLSGLAGLALIFRAIAEAGMPPAKVDEVLSDQGLIILESAWIIGLFTGFVLIAVALFRAKTVPAWVPALLLAFVVVEVLLDQIALVQKGGYLALAAAFTGVAVAAVDPSRAKADVPAA